MKRYRMSEGFRLGFTVDDLRHWTAPEDLPLQSLVNQASSTNDILQVTRSRLADGRGIADHDVVRLCDEIESLRAAMKDVSKYIWRGDFHQLDQSTRDILDHLGEKGKPKPTAIATWKCPINHPDCKKNCGSYGCGN